jgi:hypothetical protein
VLLGGANDGVRQFREVILAQLRNREADDPGLAGAQAARREIRPVVQLGDRTEHALARGRSYMREVVDDVRDGLDRDAGHPGDVVHRGDHASFTPVP